MRRWWGRWKYAVAALAASMAAANAAPVKTEHVTAELVAERQAVAPGGTVQLGLVLQHAPHWHTYWRNPGDSGLPTTLKLALPSGATASAIDWPAPQRIPIGPLVNYGYEGELLLPLTFTAPAGAVPGSVLQVKADATWLVCKDVCIPEGAQLRLALPVVAGTAAPGPQAALFARSTSLAAAPALDWSAEMQRAGSDVQLHLTRTGGAVSGDAPPIEYFPYAEQVFEPARHEVVRTARGYVVSMRLMDGAQLPERVAGIAVAPEGTSVWRDGRRVAEFDAPMREVAALTAPEGVAVAAERAGERPGAAAARPAIDGAAALGFLAAVAFAFAGGLVLNLMPCVFPVLSIKLLSLAKIDGDKRALRLQALAYSVGVVATFLALAIVLIGLRSAGSAVGWGFQLQEPGFVFLLALLFFGMGLNLIGVYQFGSLLPRRLAEWRSRRPASDAFACGVVAVVAASPCTAPFMGAAVGFAVTQSAGAALAIFAALGLGMALPYALLVTKPRWRSALPRPGAWMNRLKQGLAFPMFATVVWLLWVIGLQAGLDGTIKVLAALLGGGFVVWLLGLRGSRGRIGRLAGSAALVALAIWSWPTSQVPSAAVASTGGWQPYDAALVDRLVAEQKPVFVDFTAAWCVSCQVNKRVVLHTDETMQAFADAGVTLMRADWTFRDARITAALARFGRNGVPVYALMRPGREPLLLPEILTHRAVRDALATL